MAVVLPSLWASASVARKVGSYLFYADGAKLPVAPYKNVTHWFERLSALPCWTETAPPPRPAVAA